MKNTFTYIEKGGIFYPDLRLPEQQNIPLGKYAMMRLDFLKKHHRGTYSNLVGEAKLTEHLYEVEQQAKEQMKMIMNRLALARGVNETLKQQDQLRWVQEMNNIKNVAEENAINNKNCI